MTFSQATLPGIIPTVSLDLALVKEGPTHILCRDDQGNSRNFAKNRIVSWSVEGGRAHIEISLRDWTRRITRADDFGPSSERKTATIKRKCLNCRHEFKADPAHRICQPCKSTASWSSGEDYGLAL